jgi:signal transduction histidine kinase
VALSVVWGLLSPAPGNEAVAASVFAALAWGCGAVVRRYAGRVRASRVAVTRLHAESDARARELIAEERARIARELHDIVAHSIGVVVLQARGGRRMLNVDPDEARQAFTDIERVSTQSLEEMRRLLGMLRSHEGRATDPAASPQPGLRDLDQLVKQVRAAGLEVDITVRGERRTLPPGLDLSAYRIVQEALTNVLRHALDAHARLLLDYTAVALDVEIIDNGHPQPLPIPGHGLIGMRERAELFGGTLHCGPRPGGGFAVLAHLPAPERIQ